MYFCQRIFVNPSSAVTEDELWREVCETGGKKSFFFIISWGFKGLSKDMYMLYELSLTTHIVHLHFLLMGTCMHGRHPQKEYHSKLIMELWHHPLSHVCGRLSSRLIANVGRPLRHHSTRLHHFINNYDNEESSSASSQFCFSHVLTWQSRRGILIWLTDKHQSWTAKTP